MRSFKRSKKICSKIGTPESRHLTHFLWSMTLTLGGKFLAQVRSLLISGFIQWGSTLALYLTVRCSFYPSLFTVVYCISIRSVKRQASKVSLYVIGSLDSLNSDCRSFSYLKTVKPSVRLAIYTALLGRLAVVNRHMMGSFDYLNLSKMWDCRSFSDFKTSTGIAV